MILPGPSTPHFISYVTKIAAYFPILHPALHTHFLFVLSTNPRLGLFYENLWRGQSQCYSIFLIYRLFPSGVDTNIVIIQDIFHLKIAFFFLQIIIH